VLVRPALIIRKRTTAENRVAAAKMADCWVTLRTLGRYAYQQDVATAAAFFTAKSPPSGDGQQHCDKCGPKRSAAPDRGQAPHCWRATLAEAALKSDAGLKRDAHAGTTAVSSVAVFPHIHQVRLSHCSSNTCTAPFVRSLSSGIDARRRRTATWRESCSASACCRRNGRCSCPTKKNQRRRTGLLACLSQSLSCNSPSRTTAEGHAG
jgi:hypothetical protein